LIDDKNSNRKVAFNLVKGCKSKKYIDGNVFMAWERLKSKFESLSAPKFDDIRDDLNLRFQGLNMKSNEENEDENVLDVAIFGTQFKVKCRNCGLIGHKVQNCKNKI